MTACIVTGAASGIGAAVARRLAAQGRPLVIHTGRNRAGAEAVAGACLALGAPAARVVVGDLALGATLDEVMHVADGLGPLRGVVANAGFADRTPLADLSPQALARSWEVMVAALAQLLRASLPRLAQPLAHPLAPPGTGSAGPAAEAVSDDGAVGERGAAGRLVAISSFVAHRYTAASSAFAATAAAKAAVEALVKAAAVEYAASGVTVNAVAPGYVRKDSPGQGALSAAQWQQAAERIPMRRLATPEDIAGPICFLLSLEAGYITGQVLHVNGGLTL